jgi:hypothetical protein
MALNFSRIAPATEELEIWIASERGFSFVISNESSSGPGLHGRPGFVASWRPINLNRTAVRIGGSPLAGGRATHSHAPRGVKRKLKSDQ